MLTLENLREGEVVEVVVRRHWIVLVQLVLFLFGGFLLSLIIYTLFGFSLFTNTLNICFWLVFSVCLYVQWLNHELDLFVITNNRIIGIEQISFLNRTVTETILGQVQEVNSQTKGLLANILDYGSLKIQTAGNKTTLVMDFVPDIIQQARKINNIADLYKDKNYEKLANKMHTS